MSILAELRRRNVFQVATGYALVAWMLIEAGSVLLPTFGASARVFRAYTIIIIAGFVVAIVVAWLFELTPDGIKRESELEPGQSRPSRYANKVLVGLLVAALLVSLGFNVSGIRNRDNSATPQALTSVAVLPFENRSNDPDDRYFADGLHDDLLDRLAAIDGLKVISSTTANAYRNSPLTIAEIGNELNVAAVVEGSVQRSDNHFHVSVRVFGTEDEDRIWAESYDRDASLQGVFDLQSEISTQISSELHAALGQADTKRLTSIPTANPDAYRLYVEGTINLGLRRYDSLLLAKRQFSEAVALDPGYARAQSGLAETVMALLNNHRALPADEAYEIASTAVASALRSDPELANAYAVRGLIEARKWLSDQATGNPQSAVRDFEQALRLNANLANAYVWYAALEERLDHPGRATELLVKALDIDPRNRLPYVTLPELLSLNGDQDKATQLLLKAMQFFPDWPAPYDYLARHLQKLGRLDEAFAWLMELRRMTDDPIAGSRLWASLKTLQQDSQIDSFLAAAPDNHTLLAFGRAYSEYMSGNFQAAAESLGRLPAGTDELFALVNPLLARAEIMNGDSNNAQKHLLLAAPELRTESAGMINRFNIRCALLLAYVDQLQGHDVQERLEAVLRTSRTLPRGGLAGHGIVDVQALELLGRRTEALAALRAAIDGGFVSELPFDYWSIEQNPLLDNLRTDPAYPAISLSVEDSISTMRTRLDRAIEMNELGEIRAKSGALRIAR